MKKDIIWVSYDLGVQGDYEGLYAWLDSQHAKECGDSLAFIEYHYTKDLVSELKKELLKSFKTDKKTRIYTIRQEGEKLKGRFILGGRKTAPWAGFSPVEAGTEDVDG